MMDAGLDALQDILGHRFADQARLVEALTHPSVGGVNRRAVGKGYERLEFLGDRVLGLIVAEWLLERFPKEQEGALARRLTALVRAEALVVVAGRIGLGRFLRLAPGEQAGDVKPAILADACEAVIGALYLDGGLPAAAGFIRRHWDAALEGARAAPPQDPKTGLQEWALARGQKLPLYKDIGRSGPDHAPVFQISVEVEGHEPAIASGPSKRVAEKAAAEALLTRIRKS
ncbi:ribonuclease III [Niveispirillum fermenti]|uniref:ribonuclease III n=1 Tax=Niveispirillum fermenti TaxID=1233113 RepID=UPI003A83E59E